MSLSEEATVPVGMPEDAYSSSARRRHSRPLSRTVRASSRALRSLSLEWRSEPPVVQVTGAGDHADGSLLVAQEHCPFGPGVALHTMLASSSSHSPSRVPVSTFRGGWRSKARAAASASLGEC